MATMSSKYYEYLKASRIKKEVFQVMGADDISAIAKNDPLISLYREILLLSEVQQTQVSLYDFYCYCNMVSYASDFRRGFRFPTASENILNSESNKCRSKTLFVVYALF